MSQLVGRELPDDLYAALRGDDLGTKSGKAVGIATVDSQNFAHPALLSYTEIVAKSQRNIRLAVYSASRTARNLRQNSKLTIIVIDRNMAYYVKGTTREIRPALESFPSMAGMNMSVEEVLADRPTSSELELGTQITSGVTFSTAHESEFVSGGENVLGELLSLQ